jgi:hypothetical protein
MLAFDLKGPAVTQEVFMNRSTRRWLPLFALLGAVLCQPLAATTYMMMSDQALTDRAAAVVDVKVVGVEPAPFNGPVATDYLVEVNRVLKGTLSGSTVVVRVPGGLGPNGVGLKIWGAPEFAEGERALLFLIPGNDGAYRILHLMLGAFHERETTGRLKVLVRDLSEAHAIGSPGPDPVRNLDKFAEWVTDRGLGVERAADYLVSGSPAALALLPRKFVLLQTASGINIRWFRFDTGGTVNWQVNEGGQQGLSLPDTIGAFQTSLATWNNDAATNIRYNYLSTTSAAKGLTEPDDTNSILFNDPFAGQEGREVAGFFDCSAGGIIAIGGPWFFSSTRPYGGKQFHETVEADIVTNDGTACLFGDNRKAAEEVFTHELGHTLGLGHSQIRDATMFASVHNDGRGSRLHPDDIAGIGVLYNASGSGPKPTTKPAAPTNLTAHALSNAEIGFAWRDKSNNEDGFSVEVKVAKRPFVVVGTVPTNVVDATLTGLTPGTTYTIRIRAFNAKGSSAYSKAVVVKLPR